MKSPKTTKPTKSRTDKNKVPPQKTQSARAKNEATAGKGGAKPGKAGAKLEADTRKEPTNYRPKLLQIKVPLQQLLLDPNNPRILSDSAVPEDQFADPGVQVQADKRMKEGKFELEELKFSIIKNGWQPVDMIFVKKLKANQYVVLEGNRRLTALRDIKTEDLTPELKASIDPLEVLEVMGTKDLEESRAQVSYLLGVRHHGSLKKWGAFARAHNIFERYLRIGAMTDASFKWNEDAAIKVADTLGLDVEEVQTRLQVYRVMKQLEDCPAIKKVGMEGRYYSLIGESLSKRLKAVRAQYVNQDPGTFLVDEPTLSRLDNTCHFSTPKRKGAPIANPAEWRSLNQILSDISDGERTKMLLQVEKDKQKPSDVYALRAAALRQPRWDQWLKQVAELLKRIKLGDLETPEARGVARQLASVLDALASKPA